MLDFPSLLYKGLRILMFQLSGVYCRRFFGCSVHRERAGGLENNQKSQSQIHGGLGLRDS